MDLPNEYYNAARQFWMRTGIVGSIVLSCFFCFIAWTIRIVRRGGKDKDRNRRGD
jgi:hypothetical protein